MQKCRKVYEEANKCMSSCEEEEQRLKLLNSWKNYEKEFGSEDNMERVTKLLPEKVKRRRMLTDKGGPEEFWEEYYDYILPEDTANEPNFKLLSIAKMWKRQQETTAGETTAGETMLEETMSPPPS
ncbi:crooked neck-like protein 1 [Limanda limanda]|uniref:crooked neck-like protein 1 n=1 Tax=Limanda limanda TaxID=27771 RepID=UPI0029C8883F|nr:crooked neck-like protein 1 [Limanda limanda]XP_060939100.1 crooked neck-like protein 1 [Limanda limanda]